MRTRLLTVAMPIAALALLAGCGSNDDTATDPGGATTAPTSSAAQSPSTPASSPASNLPECSSLWSVGKKLPATYAGCQEGGVKAHSLIYQCEIGSKLATYGTQLYATPGSTIVKASPSRAKDKNWKFAYNHCVG